MLSARRCSKCGRSNGAITAFDGAYWHEPCFRNASPELRERARQKMYRKQSHARKLRDMRSE